MECMNLASYVALTQEDKIKMYKNCFSEYKRINADNKYQKALEATTEKLHRFFRSVKPAKDRMELAALQKWYVEIAPKMLPGNEDNLEPYFDQKLLLFVYAFDSLADQLSSIRKEASELLKLLSSDLFLFIDEITCTPP
jgi:hypothetical protein